MTVLMYDCLALLTTSTKEAYNRGELADLTFADDTLLLGVSTPCLQEFLEAVATAAKRYGMELHYGKLHALGVNSSQAIATPDGTELKTEDRIMYLGTVLTSDGRAQPELHRRLGMARGDFRILSKVWRHAALTKKRKVYIFDTLIVSRLLYSLTPACLLTADRRRLDGFHCRCLRQILGVQPAFLSRVSNTSVLQMAARQPLSEVLLKRQVRLLDKVTNSPTGNPLRDATFIGGTSQPLSRRYVRKVGRPRTDWVATVLKYKS